MLRWGWLLRITLLVVWGQMMVDDRWVGKCRRLRKRSFRRRTNNFFYVERTARPWTGEASVNETSPTNVADQSKERMNDASQFQVDQFPTK